jgi:hypothetical protein
MRVGLLTSEKPILLATPKCGEGGSAAEGYPAANASTGEIHFLHLVPRGFAFYVAHPIHSIHPS